MENELENVVKNKSGGFVFDPDEIIKHKVFTAHQLDDHTFAFGLTLPKDEQIHNKKEQVTGTRQVLRPCIITSDRRFYEVTEEFLRQYKIDYGDLPAEVPLRISLDLIDKWTHEPKMFPKIDGKELESRVEEKYRKYASYRQEEWYSVNALWDMGTYLMQLFPAYPLKEEQGLTLTGKTKTMIISSFMTLNATSLMINPSSATLYRQTEILRPTSYFDEAERLFRERRGVEEPDDRIELINAAYSANGVVPRQEKVGNVFITRSYHLYTAIRIGSIAGLHGATATRAITQVHTRASDRDRRGELDPLSDQNDESWQKIRDDLIIWALQNWQVVKTIYETYEAPTDLKKRDYQLWRPLIAIAHALDVSIETKLLEFAYKQSTTKKMDSVPDGSYDYQLLDSLNSLLPATNDIVYVTAIRERLDEKYPQMKGSMFQARPSSWNKSIASRLDKMGFVPYKDRDLRGTHYKLTKEVFDSIISPITKDFATSATFASFNESNSNNSNEGNEAKHIRNEANNSRNILEYVANEGNVEETTGEGENDV